MGPDPGPSRRDLEAELQRLELLTSRSSVRTFYQQAAGKVPGGGGAPAFLGMGHCRIGHGYVGTHFCARLYSETVRLMRCTSRSFNGS